MNPSSDAHRAVMRSRTPPHHPARNAGVVSGLVAPLVDGLGALVKSGVQSQPFQRDPVFIEQMRPLLKLTNLYFATEFRGWQHVPRNEPCLIVGNHSGGAATTDFAFLLHKWVEERGTEASIYGLAYDLLFSNPIFAGALRRLGIVPASHANAHRALRLGAAVSVFPGGDYEVFRPWRERNRIDFGGRTGFIRLAITSGVPVVPMTIHGAHESTLVLTRGKGFAHVTGLDRLHVDVFPFIWSIPFGLTPAFVPSLPLPSKVTVHFGAPLRWSRYRPNQACDPAVLHTCYEQITERMQETLNELAREKPHPILARLHVLDLERARGHRRRAARPTELHRGTR